MKTKNIITNCYSRCPFFKNSMDGMECSHPYWNEKNPYDNMIITHINSKDGKFPEECPLRKENLEITFELNLNKFRNKNFK